MEHHPVATGHHPVPTVLQAAAAAVVVVADRRARMAHPPTEVADHRAATEHRPARMGHRQVPTVLQAAEDPPALMVPRPVVVVLAVESHRVMELHRAVVAVAVDCPRPTEHQVSAVVARPAVTAHLPVAATDSQDHLRLTVHLAPVVAASEVDILEVEVDTLEAVAADTLEAAVVDIPEVVVTPVAAVATLEAAVVATPEAVDTPAAAVVIPAAVVAIPEAAAVATPVEVTEATLEEAVVATLEEVVVATLEEAEVVTLEVVAAAAATPAAEAARATPATEVTNINRNKSSPRATTFDHVSSVINHHRANQKYSSTTRRPKHEKSIGDAKLLRINGTSAANRRGKNEAESEVTPASSKSFATHPGSALKVR